MRPAFTKDPLFKKGLSAIYCGFPKAVDALRIMKEVYAELDASAKPKVSGRRVARRR